MNTGDKYNACRIKDKIWLKVNGRIYAMSAKRGARAQEEEAAGDLLAPFSCKILKVHVALGDSFAAGDAIVTVEAMKMEYTYSAPQAGEVKTVLVKAGQTIEEGQKFIDWSELA